MALLRGIAVLTLRYTMEHGALSGYIDDLFVRPEFRRQGIARALLSELLDECQRRSCKSIYVEVGDRNVAAIELYS
jgi:ribosomal protein S18 acetylase RimI-like enzyme